MTKLYKRQIVYEYEIFKQVKRKYIPWKNITDSN